MAWIQDLFDPQQRTWEEHYRNRWAHDRRVRSTHGVNCTGGCSWEVFVKDGIVTWELQALDYPRIDPTLPSYEPRGCQRGISYSWYLYSPLRVKYPTVRGALLDAWRRVREAHPGDPVGAWRALQADPEARARYTGARGRGGFRRASWDEVHEIMAAANMATVLDHGPDRVVGFSPIPAMSMVSYAGGTRFLQLLGGVALSFYDWYCDLPPASPEVWGEQTDVGESADWYRSRMIAVVGSNVLGTRTPDAHFLVEARHQGAKVVVFSPDFSQTARVADEWVPLHQGQDGAFWMAVNHVLLRERYVEQDTPAFRAYLERYSDAPIVVELEPAGDGTHRPGKALRAERLARTSGEEHAAWKLVMIDRTTGELVVPPGSVGHRWQSEAGHWNLELRDDPTGAPFEPALELGGGEGVPVRFPDFSDGEAELRRRVPCRRVETTDGEVLVTTVFELLLASHGVDRLGDPGAPSEGDWPAGYEDDAAPYTPAWQERFTGVSAETVIRFAREWATTAEHSGGRCSVIIGSGVNHWYHHNLIYRACITSLILAGCVGRNGGGWNHYVGQEKLAPQAPWAPIAFAGDWTGPPRLQNSPSFHYIHSAQWRYDRAIGEVCAVADGDHRMARGHTADQQALAVRCGWLPCYPQFTEPNHRIIAEAEAAGCRSDEEIVARVVERLRRRELRFAMEDPDGPDSHPRIWYIWRGNAIQASAKGHEYFLRHYLGARSGAIATEDAAGEVEDVVWRDETRSGKLDLVVDLNFRMDTSALYADIVLPAATHYEKHDLNTTDLHSFIHPLQPAVPPCWESRSDWRIFSEIAEHTAALAAEVAPGVHRDLVVTPLLHDTPGEIAQPEVRDWAAGECEPIPGRTMPNIAVVERDYAGLHRRFRSLGPRFRDDGLAMHGTRYRVDDFYDRYLETAPTEEWGGRRYPSLARARQVCEAILHFAAETNGELAHRAFEAESAKTGRDHTHLAAGTRDVRTRFADVADQPRRLLTTPFWTGITRGGRTYSAFCQNVEEGIPWRTLSGRQHLYLDHEVYRAYGEHLPTFKPRLDPAATRDLVHTRSAPGSLTLNYLTPHGKWHIHSTFGDTLRMETLSRGIEPLWLNDADAGALGVRDNDWVEVLNDHGAVVTRACVSARIPRGICFLYHATERTIGNPRSPGRGGRGGAHNSLTRARLKPLFMIGGYAQHSYFFNYWGPTGVNRDTYVEIRKLEELRW